MPTLPTDEDDVTYWHEHELPRKRRKGYDDMAPTFEEGGDEE